MRKVAKKLTRPPPSRTEDVPPRASALAESLRAFGYDLGTAIADLVDNSISAGAKNVWIDFHWAGKDSCIVITDDGRGMSESRLRDAMRLGSRHPGEKREIDDLGRFGLGLKTASFSQCRCVTVCSKTALSSSIVRRWDLDHLAETDTWQLLLDARKDAGLRFHRFEKLRTGTCVLWQHMDRVMRGIDSDLERNRDTFIARCEEVQGHLALVFHRLIEKPKRLRLFINDHVVGPMDPFFISDATQVLQEHTLPSPGGTVLVEPFVMPHESKLLDADSRRLAGDPKDWTSRQGFYIYRQDRLLVAGSWLGYRDWRKDEHHKLARIRVSLPNTSDEDWQIDVTKSKARPPEALRNEFRLIGASTRARAKRVFTFRGERMVSSQGKEVRFVWEQLALHGKTRYRISREHPSVAALLADKQLKRQVEAVLRLIEDSIPAAQIIYNSLEAEDNLVPAIVETDAKAVRAMLLQAWHALKNQGLRDTDAIGALSHWEPFNIHPALLQELKDNPPSHP